MEENNFQALDDIFSAEMQKSIESEKILRAWVQYIADDISNDPFQQAVVRQLLIDKMISRSCADLKYDSILKVVILEYNYDGEIKCAKCLGGKYRFIPKTVKLTRDCVGYVVSQRFTGDILKNCWLSLEHEIIRECSIFSVKLNYPTPRDPNGSVAFVCTL